MLRYQEPKPHHVSGNFIGQELPDLSFEASRVCLFDASFLGGAKCFNIAWLSVWLKFVEFFFVGRNR